MSEEKEKSDEANARQRSKEARAADPIFDDQWIDSLMEQMGACRHGIVGGCRKCVRHRPQSL